MKKSYFTELCQPFSFLILMGIFHLYFLCFPLISDIIYCTLEKKDFAEVIKTKLRNTFLSVNVLSHQNFLSVHFFPRSIHLVISGNFFTKNKVLCGTKTKVCKWFYCSGIFLFTRCIWRQLNLKYITIF